ncbi:uncharacterized protein [Nicotiana tomentosiformis]|uniref:uncharacterized protein n=1 Tax=Nicotiana tomentosiformis TaxID=4098 RepID=UPI00388C340A
MPRGSLDTLVLVSIPVSDYITVYRSCMVTICGYETSVDLLFLSMVDLDVTFRYELDMPVLLRLEWRGSLGHTPSKVISFLKAQRMVEKGCLDYLAFVQDVSADTPRVDSVLMVREFLDMFPADLQGMPPDMDIDNGIGLVSGTQPIFISLYRMDLVELKELKEQLQELMDKGFIRPSVSPWGAPVLFVKKKDVSIRMCIDYR